MRVLHIIGAAALAACAESEEVTYDPNLAEASPPAEAGADSGNSASDSEALPERPAIDGPSQWFARTRDGERWAGYGPPFSETTVSVRCEQANGRLVFSTVAMPRSGPGRTTMHLTAQNLDQQLPAQASDEGLPNTEASVPADEDWLDRLVSASGDLTVRVGSTEPIVVPISEPLTSLIRDCRR